ncbi:hypothetical protein N7488_000012 [Penicillium malachiteum]|nr:hypothetical protein N7488_000012 [Penicillium malachiteum]
MAFVPCFLSVFKDISTTETHKYAFKAHTLISGILQSPPTLESMQTSLLLCSADMLLSSTARLLFLLEANKHSIYPSQKFDRFKDHFRNLFWAAYAIDKELSLRTGNPPTLSDDECDLDLPDVSESYCYENGPTDLGLVSFFPNHLPLSILQSQIYNELYSVKAQRKSETELLLSIRKLDNQLEQWKNAISLAQHQVYDDSTR